jgi:hypothetical protein
MRGKDPYPELAKKIRNPKLNLNEQEVHTTKHEGKKSMWELAGLSRHGGGGSAEPPRRLCRRPAGLGEGPPRLEHALQLSGGRGADTGWASGRGRGGDRAAHLSLLMLQVRTTVRNFYF